DVFMTERDGPMMPKAFHALFGRIGARAKMQFPVHPLMLRRTCAGSIQELLAIIVSRGGLRSRSSQGPAEPPGTISHQAAEQTEQQGDLTEAFHCPKNRVRL